MVDLAWGLWRNGYLAIALDRARRSGADSYVSRLLGRRAVVVHGAGGAELFYDERLVQREAAVPAPLAWLLFGRGAVHGLDGERHLDRKQLFLETLTPSQVAPCAEAVGRHLERAVQLWDGREVKVHPELVQAYGSAVLEWVGAQVTPSRARRLSQQYAAIVNGFGFAGVAYGRAWAARVRTDAWARGLVDDVRRGRTQASEGSVLATIAHSGLDARTAGVELGNVVRPTIAVAWLGTFAVLALDEAVEWRERLADREGDADRWSFAQEVRRTTPFVPALAGRMRAAATYDGLELRPGDRVVLDVRGINLDPSTYDDPTRFRPDRFLGVQPGPFTLVPQGGGFPTGHRCPGESMAMQVLAETVRVLAGVDFTVTSSPMLDLGRIPTLPPEGLRIRIGERHIPKDVTAPR